MSEADAPYAPWIGRQRVVHDVITQAPVSGLSAALDYSEPLALSGDALPSCWHWLYFLEPAPASNIDHDGHPKRGDFLPPIELPRRMWAGSRLRFHAPLRVGDEARCVSTIVAIEHKHGRSGELVFVTLRHEVYRDEDCLLEEEQDLVFRNGVSNGTSASGPRPADVPTQTQTVNFARHIRPDPVLLFRYSALTLNSHRIHYDREYATKEEGYDGLVVQGPLVATLLLDLLQREYAGAAISTFEFRGMQPLTDTQSIRLCANVDSLDVALWAVAEPESVIEPAIANRAGAVAMRARAQLVAR